jgi:hypothetical protein
VTPAALCRDVFPPSRFLSLSTEDINDPMNDRAALVSSAHALLHLALSNAGPRALLSVLQSSTHSESLTVTTSSARILPELCVGHAATRLLVQTARSHRVSNYDGGWLLISVAAGLIVRAFSSADRPPVHLLLAGHQVALQWCYDFFNHPRFFISLSFLKLR